MSQVLVTAQPESHRPLRCSRKAETCPRLLEHVDAWLLFQHSDSRKNVYVVGNREVDRYISVPGPKLPLVLRVLSLFDGAHSLDSIQAQFNIADRKRVDVQKLYHQMYANGLLASPTPARVNQGDIEKMSVRVFAIPVQKLFILLRSFHGVFFPWLVAVMFLLIVAGTEQAVAHRKMLMAPAQSVWNGTNRAAEVLLYPMLLLVSFLFHEMAHGVVASRYGIFARRFEGALYLGFIPIIYLRIPGLYTLRPVDRIKVWSAGIYWNLAFASFIVLLLQSVTIAPPWRKAWVLVALANYFLAFTNLFPFLPTDGYFILCTLLKTYNVRSKAWKEFRACITASRRFSTIPVVYFICTVLVAGLILWRDVAWLYQVQNRSWWAWKFGLAFLIAPWLLLLWRWVWIRSVSIREDFSTG